MMDYDGLWWINMFMFIWTYRSINDLHCIALKSTTLHWHTVAYNPIHISTNLGKVTATVMMLLPNIKRNLKVGRLVRRKRKDWPKMKSQSQNMACTNSQCVIAQSPTRISAKSTDCKPQHMQHLQHQDKGSVNAEPFQFSLHTGLAIQ